MDNSLKIVNYLGKNLHQSFTMHQLSTLLSIPYASFYRTVEKIKDKLILEKVGKSTTIRLNTENPIIKSFLAIASEEEKKVHLRNNPLLRKIASELEDKSSIVALFGSYASKSHTEKSDIDILVINDKGNRNISFSKYELLFKKKINPIFITKREFKLMLKEKEENLGKQVLKNHIILKNPELFWGVVLDGI